MHNQEFGKRLCGNQFCRFCSSSIMVLRRHATKNNGTNMKGGRCFFSKMSSDVASRFRAGWNGLKRLIGLAQLFFLHAQQPSRLPPVWKLQSKDGVKLLLLKGVLGNLRIPATL